MNYSFEPLGAFPVLAEPEVPPVVRPVAPPPREVEPVRQVTVPALPDLDPTALARRTPLDPTDADREIDLERARSEAHLAGFEEGRRSEGVRVATAVESVRALIAQVERADERRHKEAVERIAILATAIAAHLVEREVRTSPEIIADVVRRAVAEFPVTDPLTVHLHPSDLALLSSSGLSGPSVHQHLTSGQTVRWIADPTVRSGGCLVEGAERILDGRLSHTLERICEVLTDA